MSRSPARTKTCLNPDCGRQFTPGHYGDKQKVCTGNYTAKCRHCKGKDCKKCAGAGAFTQSCKAWYREFWSKTRLSHPPRAVPDRDFSAILSHLKGDIFWWTFFVVSRESALRKGEQLGLVWSDVLNADGRIRSTILVRGQWKDRLGFRPTKTGEPRPAYLMLPARKALAAFLKTLPQEDGWASSRIWEVTKSSVWSKWTGIQRELGIANPDTREPYRVHDIRHTAAFRVYKATKDLRNAQKLLGHGKLTTSEIYTVERGEDFVNDLEKAVARKRKKRK